MFKVLLAIRSTVAKLLLSRYVYFCFVGKITIHAFIVQFGPSHGLDLEAFHIAFDLLRGFWL